MPRLPFRYRLRIVIGIVCALIIHFLEVLLFTLSYYWLSPLQRFGSLSGNFDASFMDFLYFSFSAYTSLGYGDIVPIGNLRLLAGMEALTGLVLIAWTASFMYIKMEKYWEVKQ